MTGEQGIRVSSINISRSAQPDYTKTTHHFIGDIFGRTEVDANDKCQQRGGVAYVESYKSRLQFIISTLTFGIYTPRNVNVYCAR